jgi:HEAT repeat protein
MCVALKDASKLVRWRAARFLNEKGTPEALPYLKAAVNDDQFEVKLEVEAAIDRIESGGDLQMPAWKRIAGLET